MKYLTGQLEAKAREKIHKVRMNSSVFREEKASVMCLENIVKEKLKEDPARQLHPQRMLTVTS